MLKSKNYNCVHCGYALEKTQTDPNSDWMGEILYICFNNSCSFYKNSFLVMKMQGATGGYRYYYSESGQEGSLLILTDNSFTDRICHSWYSETEPEPIEPDNEVVAYLKQLEKKLDQILLLIKGSK